MIIVFKVIELKTPIRDSGEVVLMIERPVNNLPVYYCY